MLGHAVGINAKARLSLRLSLKAGPNVHAGGIEPYEKRLPIRVGTLHEAKRAVEKFLVNRFHALLGEGARVLAALLAPLAEARLLASRFRESRLASQYAPGPKAHPEFQILGIVRMLGLVLCI